MNLAARREEEEGGQSSHRGQGGDPEGQGQEVGVLLRINRDIRAEGAPQGWQDLRPYLGLREHWQEAHQGGPEGRV